jgi:hypothetical protein
MYVELQEQLTALLNIRGFVWHYIVIIVTVLKGRANLTDVPIIMYKMYFSRYWKAKLLISMLFFDFYSSYSNILLQVLSQGNVIDSIKLVFLDKLTVRQLVKKFASIYGMRSVPHSQEPAIWPYLELDESSPHPRISNWSAITVAKHGNTSAQSFGNINLL